MIYYAIKTKDTNEYYSEHFEWRPCFNEIINGTEITLLTSIEEVNQTIAEFKVSTFCDHLELEAVKVIIEPQGNLL